MTASRRSVLIVAALLTFALAAPALTAAPGKWLTGKPAENGMSAERLDRIGRVMQTGIDAGKAAGVVTLVARNGKIVYLKSFGKMNVEKGTAMPVDAIFRVASQSKAITSTALMTLVEEGRLVLNDPVSKFIPEFKAARVAVASKEKGAKGYYSVPVKRPITIRDLLTHTAGISYGTNGPAADEYKAAGVQGWFFADKDEPVGECVQRLAALPFDAQPGEEFVYGFNTDILGRVIEVVSGLSLADYVRTRITEPLGMADTCFFLPKEKAARLTSVYGINAEGKLVAIGGPHETAYVDGPRKCFSGGAGILSTASDYARFLQMMLNGGELDGARVLGPKTVQLMTTPQLGALYNNGKYGFGLAFWITEDLARTGGDYGTAGAFGWGGAYETTYWVDPVEKLVGVFMIQMLPASDFNFQVRYKDLVYQAITDSYLKR